MRKLFALCISFILLTPTIIAMEITSSAFSNEGLIPAKYTCNGNNISPPLEWGGVPDKTKSLALIMDDPDAPMGTYDHWVVFNIPPTTTGFAEAVTGYPEGTQLGLNSSKKAAYTGPCPPDKIHRYFFKLYALDVLLDLKTGASKANVLSAMKGHILGEAQLMGRYDQPRNTGSKK